MFKCHCRDCQRVTGAPFTAAVFVPVETFRLTRGQLRFHTTPSAMGGRHRRGFCAECGARLTGGQTEGEEPTHIGFTAASLDDPSWFRPQCEIWTQDVQPWDPLDPAIPHFPKYPPP